MAGGPIACRQIFLRDLTKQDQGDKVRFLGCVTHYDIAHGVLHLRHASSSLESQTAEATTVNKIHQRDIILERVETSSLVEARVNLDHVLETVRQFDLEIGTWLNIIGYVGKTAKNSLLVAVDVQGVMLWNAGSVDVDEYDQILKARQKLSLT